MSFSSPFRVSLPGMLRRWDDSQRYLANMPHLICEETANYLILWCTKLQQEGVIKNKTKTQTHTKNDPTSINHQGLQSSEPWCWLLKNALLFSCVLQKEALMDQVAHQVVVIQFILEMAANSQQDPRGCFRQFFSKAKVGDTNTRVQPLLLLEKWR